MKLKKILIAVCLCIMVFMAVSAVADVEWVKHSIDANVGGPWDVYVDDLNLDQRKDLIVVAYHEDSLIWYVNDGNTRFIKHVIDYVNGAVEVCTGDVDGDGDKDIVAAAHVANRIVWWENDGGQNFRRYTILDDYDGVKCVALADINGDNAMDMVSCAYFEPNASGDSGDVSYWEGDPDPGRGLTRMILDSTFFGAHDVEIADIDGDGDLDIAAAAYGRGHVAVYLNQGQAVFNKITLDRWLPGARDIYVVDMDGDSSASLDILAAASLCDQIVWYKNQSHIRYLVDGDVYFPMDAEAADFDNDGDTDVVATSLGIIQWYENDGLENFTKHIIADDLMDTVGNVIVNDLDEDGRVDIIVCMGQNNELAWWENTDGGTGVESGDTVPEKPAIFINYPNPFNSATIITYDLPAAGNVTLEIYNLMGRKVAIPVDGWVAAGHYSIRWNAASYSSGIYFYRLTTGDKVYTKRMTLLK
jgi:hypothetical protein